MTTTFSQRLLDDHLHLAALCNRIVAEFEAGDREACDDAFRHLEHELEAHLNFEEQELLPRFALTHPVEAAALLADHKRFRARLTELGIGIDLHLTRCNAVRSLVIDLAEHARHEGEVLYRWAERELDPETRSAWMARRHLL